MIGKKLGPYQIVSKLGQGGMGEVYRATDTNLKRSVAIKVLPAALATDADRLARFQREAEVLASLNHPNIAAIYGLERTDGTTALVMELVEGPTLAERIAQAAIPVDEALAIAKQIAQALDAAHEQGIIHRDLKPANVKVRPDGAVKVLDFGLAKAFDQASGSGLQASGRDFANSPTITSPVMTGAGMLLGTAPYMSPEQARGRAVDKRTDIWAFGAVLYEMLTGQRAFKGDDVSDVLASVLAREPDWSLLPAELPPLVGSCIKRCLQKDRKQRIRDIGDVLLTLEGAWEGPTTLVAPSTAIVKPVWRRALPIAATAIVTIAVAALAAWRLWPASQPQAVTRFDYVLPAGYQIPPTQRSVIAVSPDGRHFIYQTMEGLRLRSLEDLEARLIPGTEGNVMGPFFSPDGQWVGYFGGVGGIGAVGTMTGHLQKIAVSGGAPVIVCTTAMPFGASWALDNTILFGQSAGIMRVSANGGTPEIVVRAGAGEQINGPQLLPDGDLVLFSVTTDTRPGPTRWDQAQIVVQSLSSGKRTVIVQAGTDARYLPTGHLVYALRDSLFAIAFDAKQLKVTGGALPVVQAIERPPGVNAAGSNYSVSSEGTLVYLAATASLRSLVWINRNGTSVAPVTSIPVAPYEDPRLSPNGDRVLVTRDGDIWIYDLASGRSSRFTNDGTSLMGVWDPTGTKIAYSSARKGNLEAWVAPADGSGDPRQLTSLGGQVHVDSWSPDGRTLSIHHHPPNALLDVFMLPMDQADAKPELFLKGGKFSAEGAEFSRDGRYVSFLSQQTGQREIYIRPFSQQGGQVTVSVSGGREPVWAANGEVFYRSLSGDRMFAVSVTTAPALKVGTPVQLFQGPYYIAPTGSPRPQYDVSADGQRFLMLAPAPGSDVSATRPRIVVVQNWFEELKRRVPMS